MQLNLPLVGLFLLLSIFIIGCTAKTSSPISEQVAKDKIIILLEKKAMPTPLTKQLREYEATAKGPSSRSENRWIITYNTQLIKPEKMLQKIKAFPEVLEAEFMLVKTDL